MPAPVKGMMVEAAAIMSPSCSTPLRRSDAIMKRRSVCLGCADYSTAKRISPSIALVFGCDAVIGDRGLPLCSGCFGDRRLVGSFALLAFALARLRIGRRGLPLIPRLAVLRQAFHFPPKRPLPTPHLFP